jgi:hypothetical protein
MIEAGTIKAANVGRETVVSEASIRELTPKEQLPEYLRHAHLKTRQSGSVMRPENMVFPTRLLFVGFPRELSNA